MSFITDTLSNVINGLVEKGCVKIKRITDLENELEAHKSYSERLGSELETVSGLKKEVTDKLFLATQHISNAVKYFDSWPCKPSFLSDWLKTSKNFL